MAELGVGHLPGRKRPALYVERDGRIIVLAYFQSDEALAEFMAHKPQYSKEASHAI